MNFTFFLALNLLFWSYFMYPFFLKLLLFLGIKRKVVFYNNYTLPSVTLVIVAHNEELVIKKRLDNALKLNYPKNKLSIIVASDFSTDKTNEIVDSYSSKGVFLYKTKERKGKANAQNEVCETITSEVFAFSDANSMWENDALINLVSNFKDEKVGYVTGKLEYVNIDDNGTSNSEGLYWRYELLLRDLESRVQSITAGNGAIYAIRRSVYEPINVLYNHDFELPSLVRKKNMYSIYDKNSIAKEKAGETSDDEYKRKVRMLGRTWHKILHDFSIFNPLKVGFLYSIFMFSHRLLRYSTGILQLVILILNILLFDESLFFQIFLYLQIIFYFLSVLGIFYKKNKIIYIHYYFNLFQLATLIGFIKALTNNVKPFWESPQSTRN